LPSPSPALYRNRTTLLPQSSPRCFGTGHTAVAFRSSRPASASTTILFLNRMIPSVVAATSVAVHATRIADLDGIATPPEASLAAHNSVATASDRHIPLKGCRLHCLVYHSAAFNSSSNSRTLLYRNRRLYPVALYLSFSLLLPSSRTAATTASFSLLATVTIAQPWITAASAAPHANVAAF
ncbi:hypothetical protein GW17_00049241, partial [Ensete ventricosum]